MKIPMTEATSPPIVPAARGNQNGVLSPIINGTNPRMVDMTVRKMGIIFTFHAFV